MSGPDAHAVLAAVCVGGGPRPDPGGCAGAATVRLEIGGPGPLPALAVGFIAPRSATGEDIAELLLPGNPALVERTIEALIAAGDGAVRRAGPGEFTARAFLAGKLDLIQAEGIARLIASRTEAERRAAERLCSGVVGERYAAWSGEAAELLALVEAGIDFSDQEDVVAITPRDLSRRIEDLARRLDASLAGSSPREHREGTVRVVLVGEPNAGKSTLFNALLGRERAVVSPAAGSTRDVLCEPLDLSAACPGAGVVELCDLAGIDPASTGDLGAAAQRAAASAADRADVLIVCDPGARFDRVLASLGGEGGGVGGGAGRILVRTKADLPGAAEAGGGMPVCALDGWGIGSLRRAIADLATPAGPGEGDVLPRHRSALLRARAALAEALEGLDPEAPTLRSPELAAASLLRAVDALGEIAGATTPEDILGRIFATFCVGK